MFVQSVSNPTGLTCCLLFYHIDALWHGRCCHFDITHKVCRLVRSYRLRGAEKVAIVAFDLFQEICYIFA